MQPYDNREQAQIPARERQKENPLSKLLHALNPFKDKTPEEADELFREAGYTSVGPDPMAGKGAYINDTTGTSWHIDPNEGHVDVITKLHPAVQKAKGKRKFPLKRVQNLDD